MTGPCAKTVVTCTIVAPDGRQFVGRNDCGAPQATCPRAPGEGYEKCRTICAQESHAEVSALRSAGRDARGAHAYIEGISYACRQCQEALTASGVAAFTIGAPRVRKPLVMDIIHDVAARRGVEVADIVGRRRGRYIDAVRAEAMDEALSLTGHSLSHIGRVFRRHHTAVAHAVRVHAERVGT